MPDSPIKTLQVLHSAPKHKGVDTVVRLVEVDGEHFIDIRDRITMDAPDGGLFDSFDDLPEDAYVWGRGYLLPFGLLDEIVDALVHVAATGQPTPVVA